MVKSIAVFFGGASSEHDVSILTGLQIVDLAPSNFDVVPVFVCLENKMWISTKKLDAKQYSDFENNKHFFEQVVVVLGSLFKVKNGKFKKICEIDFAINACHGGSGENGEFAGFLKQNGIACSVGDSLALGIAMDKVIAKSFFKGNEIPVLEGFGFSVLDWKNKKFVFEKLNQIGFPVAVKPARQGSSIGVAIAKNEKEFVLAVESAFCFDDKILIEKGLENFSEFNCSVIFDGEEIFVSEIEEPIRSSSILSFEDKYLSSKKNGAKKMNVSKISPKGMVSLSRKFPAEIDFELKNQIQNISTKCVKELGLFGVVRLDFLFDGSNLFLNEINAVPGSLSFYFWKQMFPSSKFFEKLCEIAKFQKTKFNRKIVFKSVWKSD